MDCAQERLQLHAGPGEVKHAKENDRVRVAVDDCIKETAEVRFLLLEARDLPIGAVQYAGQLHGDASQERQGGEEKAAGGRRDEEAQHRHLIRADPPREQEQGREQPQREAPVDRPRDDPVVRLGQAGVQPRPRPGGISGGVDVDPVVARDVHRAGLAAIGKAANAAGERGVPLPQALLERAEETGRTEKGAGVVGVEARDALADLADVAAVAAHPGHINRIDAGMVDDL